MKLKPVKLAWYERYAEYCRSKKTNRIILDRESSEPYLERFYLVPRWVTLGLCRVVIHRFWKGDTDSAWHDHPWPWSSLILKGGYWEHRPHKKTKKDTRTWRGKGSFTFRKATDLHYIEMDQNHKEVWTMFVMWTPPLRDWGFQSFDFKTWTQWEEYLTDKLNKSKVVNIKAKKVANIKK